MLFIAFPSGSCKLFIANLISQFIQQHVVVTYTLEETPTTVLSGVAYSSSWL